MRRFAAGVVEFLRKHVRPVPKLASADLDRIFRALDSNRFKERESASQELDSIGAAAVPGVKAPVCVRPPP